MTLFIAAGSCPSSASSSYSNPPVVERPRRELFARFRAHRSRADGHQFVSDATKREWVGLLVGLAAPKFGQRKYSGFAAFDGKARDAG
jgi:hypothetical protein